MPKPAPPGPDDEPPLVPPQPTTPLMVWPGVTAMDAVTWPPAWPDPPVAPVTCPPLPPDPPIAVRAAVVASAGTTVVPTVPHEPVGLHVTSVGSGVVVVGVVPPGVDTVDAVEVELVGAAVTVVVVMAPRVPVVEQLMLNPAASRL